MTVPRKLPNKTEYRLSVDIGTLRSGELRISVATRPIPRGEERPGGISQIQGDPHPFARMARQMSQERLTKEILRGTYTQVFPNTELIRGIALTVGDIKKLKRDCGKMNWKVYRSILMSVLDLFWVNQEHID